MISLYTTAFNLKDFNVDLDDCLANWFYYADEIVIATLKKDEEDVREKITSSKFSDSEKITLVSADLDIPEDVYWDGKLKNTSLQSCRYNVAIQVDLDERLSGDKEGYIQIAKEINKHDFPCSVMLPTINLYGDLDHFADVGYKWYMHTREHTFRGPVNFALKNDGNFDPEKSDTCELIDEKGNLIPCIGKIAFTNNDPKVIHLGFLDIQRRANLNKNFWKDIWSERKTLSQKKKVEATNVLTNVSEFDPPTKLHNLPKPLWPKI